MENGIFKGGVQPGGPGSQEEIKMLLCYVLSQVGEPMRFDQLHETLQENGLVNYFELIQAVEGLAKSGHLSICSTGEEERYQIEEPGRQAAKELEKGLPLSVREKAVASARRMLRISRRESEVGIQVRKVDRGYQMELSIPEQEGNLVSFTLFLPTREECEQVRRRFLNDPIFIYQGVLALLTGDRKVLGELFPGEDGPGK